MRSRLNDMSRIMLGNKISEDLLENGIVVECVTHKVSVLSCSLEIPVHTTAYIVRSVESLLVRSNRRTAHSAYVSSKP